MKLLRISCIKIKAVDLMHSFGVIHYEGMNTFNTSALYVILHSCSLVMKHDARQQMPLKFKMWWHMGFLLLFVSMI